MKKLLVVLFVATLGVMVEAQQQQPSWLPEMPPADVLWGIGSAKQSNPGLAKSIAETRARASISMQLNVSIKTGVIDYISEWQSQGVTVTASKQESITRIVSESQLIGSKVINVWVAPDGTYWCRIQYSKEEAKRWVREILKDKGEETYDPEVVAKYVDSSIDASAGTR